MEALNKYLNICIPYSVWSCDKYPLSGGCNVELITDVNTCITGLVKTVHPITAGDIENAVVPSA